SIVNDKHAEAWMRKHTAGKNRQVIPLVISWYDDESVHQQSKLDCLTRAHPVPGADADDQSWIEHRDSEPLLRKEQNADDYRRSGKRKERFRPVRSTLPACCSEHAKRQHQQIRGERHEPV